MKGLLNKTNNQKVLIYLKYRLGETNLAKIADHINIEASLVTPAIKELEEAKLVDSRVDGREKLVKINKNGRKALLDVNVNFIESNKFKFYFEKIRDKTTRGIAIRALKELVTDNRKPKHIKFLDNFFDYVKKEFNDKETISLLKKIREEKEKNKEHEEFHRFLEDLLFVLMHLCIKLDDEITDDERKEIAIWLGEKIESKNYTIKLKEKFFDVWNRLHIKNGAEDIISEVLYLIKTTDDDEWNNVDFFVDYCISEFSVKGDIEDKIWLQLKDENLDDRSRKRYERIILKLTKRGIGL